MTLTINLSEKQDAALKAQARATGISEAGFGESIESIQIYDCGDRGGTQDR